MDWPIQFPQAYALEAGPYRATVVPAAGGRLSSLSCHTGGYDVELLVPMPQRAFAPHAWPKAGAFPMVPFANRMPAGPWRIANRELELPMGPSGGPIHGFGHRRPWQVVRYTPSAIEMTLMHDGASEGWPWAFRAELHVGLSELGCEVTLCITCLDDVHPMPVAIGWHPYHPLAADSHDPTVYLSAAEVLELDDFGFVSRSIGHNPNQLVAKAGGTVALEHWKGIAQSALNGTPARLVVESTGFAHAVLHRPRESTYVCLEPVSLLPGTLLATSSGVTLLSRGETAAGTWRCALSEPDTLSPSQVSSPQTLARSH